MNTQTVTEVVNFLTNNPGYLKCGDERIAFRIGCTVDKAKMAKQWMKSGIEEEIDKVNNIEDLPEVTHMPNILIVDIETSPLKAYVWRLWKQDIYLDQLISDWFCLAWSAKWLNHPETMSEVLTPEEVAQENDKRIMKKLWDLLNDADIVVAHNGNSFDIPKIKSRFLLNDLPPTSFYHQIDTKVVAAKEFGFSSNKLDALAKHFNLPLKMDTDFKLWARCMNGEDEALKYMEEYNRYDVQLLEKVYLRLRPWIKNHPNVTLYDDKNPNRCPSCGGVHLYKEDYYYTSVGKFQVYRCQDCGALSRDRKAIKRGIVTSNLSLGK